MSIHHTLYHTIKFSCQSNKTQQSSYFRNTQNTQNLESHAQSGSSLLLEIIWALRGIMGILTTLRHRSYQAEMWGSLQRDGPPFLRGSAARYRVLHLCRNYGKDLRVLTRGWTAPFLLLRPQKRTSSSLLWWKRLFFLLIITGTCLKTMGKCSLIHVKAN